MLFAYASCRTYGWHSDDGHFFNGDGEGDLYSQGGSQGDVVGCGISQRGDELFFTRNGRFLGAAVRFPLCELKSAELFPTVGLDGKGVEVEANFGDRPFVFDYSTVMRSDSNREGMFLLELSPRIRFFSKRKKIIGEIIYHSIKTTYGTGGADE